MRGGRVVGNSIEEDIKILEELRTHGYAMLLMKYEDRIKTNRKIDQALEHIVLKENEELKQDRNNNYQMIALAQNEALGYMQGYEDGKKLKRSAVANIVENQQYYIIKKQIEKYEEHMEKLQKENKELKESNEILNDAYWNECITKQTIKDKIEEILNNNEYRIVFEGDAEFPDEATTIKAQEYIKLDVLQELLEGRE
jgi:hypothetical protein